MFRRGRVVSAQCGRPGDGPSARRSTRARSGSQPADTRTVFGTRLASDEKSNHKPMTWRSASSSRRWTRNRQRQMGIVRSGIYPHLPCPARQRRPYGFRGHFRWFGAHRIGPERVYERRVCIRHMGCSGSSCFLSASVAILEPCVAAIFSGDCEQH